MPDKIKKAIKNVSINYEDKTQDKLEYYALVGWNKGTWYKILFSPSKTNDKIEMNNKLVELSQSMLKSIKQ